MNDADLLACINAVAAGDLSSIVIFFRFGSAARKVGTRFDTPASIRGEPRKCLL